MCSSTALLPNTHLVVHVGRFLAVIRARKLELFFQFLNEVSVFEVTSSQEPGGFYLIVAFIHTLWNDSMTISSTFLVGFEVQKLVPEFRMMPALTSLLSRRLCRFK